MKQSLNWMPICLLFITVTLSSIAQNSHSQEGFPQEIHDLKILIHDLKSQHTKETNALREEIQSLRRAYDRGINELAKKVTRLEATDQSRASVSESHAYTDHNDSSEPTIEVILNGKFSDFSERDSELPGFGIGEEGKRGRESLAIDESELIFSTNIDDFFYGGVTVAVAREDGEDIIELEEAYIQTLPGFGLPAGMTLKAGRALWKLGYLNEHHTHEDAFADRPLPYRAYLNKSFNDDGIEASYLLSTDFYAEIGGGAFRGEEFPGGSPTGSSPQSYSAFVRVGSGIGDNQSWQIGGHWLGSESGERLTNEDMVSFIGDSDLASANLSYAWIPTGNSNEREVTLRGEIFWRGEDGSYQDLSLPTAVVPFDGDSSGWYMQGVYKFRPKWRIGARYSELQSSNTPNGLVGSALDARGHNPESLSIMIDWTNSEFSRLRLQYNHEELRHGAEDNQLILQYIVNLGTKETHEH